MNLSNFQKIESFFNAKPIITLRLLTSESEGQSRLSDCQNLAVRRDRKVNLIKGLLLGALQLPRR